MYNGNISQTSWNTLSTDKSAKTYTYSYDALNRITRATGVLGNKYDVSGITYDKNGNIRNLQRKRHIVENPIASNSSDFGLMDNLKYTYANNNTSNQLIKVEELTGYGFKDGANATTEYIYDVNGNMTKDLNKGITNITYNHLNLPTYIIFGGLSSGKSVSYTYDASGVKLSKTVNNSGNTTITEYASNYIYKNNTLEFFNQPEGYVSPVNASDISQGFKYVYQYKDHLGNVRLSYADNNNDGVIQTTGTGTEIIEESNYYPFGLKHKGYNNVTSSLGNASAQKKGFNGMELGEELGLDWYDYTARNYDPALGRWMNLDPLAEQMRRHSPYNFAFNNPIYFIDPDGMAPVANGEEDDDKVIIVDKCNDACDNNSGEVSSNTQRLLDILNKGLEGVSTVEITSKGELFLSPTGKKGKASERSSKLSNFLGDIFSNENTITLSVSNDSKKTLGGSFETGDIDVSDMEKFGNGPLESASETIVHEFAEQYEKQINGVTNFQKAHKTANEAEASISGNKKLEHRTTKNFTSISLPFKTSEGTRFMKININIQKASIKSVKQ